MEERIKMNTLSLQEHFKAEYEDFFARNDLVVSVNPSMVWNLCLGKHSDRIHIKQKVPTKLFCGVNKINEKKIEFNTIHFFDILDKKFDTAKFNEINRHEEKIKKLLLDFFDENGYDGGMAINFLSENPRGHGFGFSGTAAALIATSVYMIINKISKDTFKQYDEFIKSREFKGILSLGTEIEKFSKDGQSIGGNTYAAMANTSLPIVLFCEDMEKEDAKVYRYEMKDLFGIKNEIEELHLDYGIIFSGAINKVEHRHHVTQNHEKELQDLEKFTAGIFASAGIKSFKRFAFDSVFDSGFYQTFKDMAFVYNFKTLQKFKGILEKGFDEKAIHDFIETFRENYYLADMVEGSNRMIELFDHYFNIYRKFDDESYAVYPVNYLKIGGSFVFVSKFKKSRETITKVLDKLKEIGYQDLSLEYASWIDGSSDSGITIDQYISDSVFSKYIEKNKVYYKNNVGESMIDSYEQIIKSENEGLLLDTINGKIYINGRKLTSNDLHSQVGTIHILEKCLEAPEKDISNNEFDISGYSKNKNEMTGKIIIPLIELIHKETGEKLPLICKGSIYDFYIKLNPCNLKIGIIKKI